MTTIILTERQKRFLEHVMLKNNLQNIRAALDYILDQDDNPLVWSAPVLNKIWANEPQGYWESFVKNDAK